MKMPSDVSLMLTQVISDPPPAHPVRGSTYGVGKKYRANCRFWQKRMKAWKKGPKTRTIKTYVPVATIEMVTTTPAEPRDNHWDQPRRIPTSFEATFTVKPESRGLFFGQV